MRGVLRHAFFLFGPRGRNLLFFGTGCPGRRQAPEAGCRLPRSLCPGPIRKPAACPGASARGQSGGQPPAPEPLPGANPEDSHLPGSLCLGPIRKLAATSPESPAPIRRVPGTHRAENPGPGRIPPSTCTHAQRRNPKWTIPVSPIFYRPAKS